MSAAKTFRTWLVVSLVAFSVNVGGIRYHLREHPRKVLIVVDASYPMAPIWDRAMETARSLAGRKNQLYAVATEKGLVHGWANRADFQGIVPYAPRNLDGLLKRLPTEVADADEVVLVTNAPGAEAAKSGVSKTAQVPDK